ncbi:MAG: TonB family protein [Alphaproteobacteria bacterium]
MVSPAFPRWPVAASLVIHAAVLGAVVAYEASAPEPPPKPVEMVMTALPTTMDALSMEAEDATPTPPEAAQPVRPMDTVQPVPADQTPPPVPVETARPVEPTKAPPPPPDEVQTAKVEEIRPEKPIEQVAEVIPDATQPVEERVEQRAHEPPPPPQPKPRRPQPRPVQAPSTVVSDAPAPAPAPMPSPAPPAQTAMLAPPVPRAAPPAGPSQSYLAALRAQLERHKTYPPMAQRRRMEGTTTVRFVLGRNGAVLSHRIVTSSGFSILDREVEELLQRATPLPPLPADVVADTLEIVVPISFYLR